MNKKKILAYFKDPDTADKVSDQLKDLGITDIQIDRFSKYSSGSIEQLTNPLNGNTPSQAALTLGANGGQDTGILASSDVSASGMSDGSQDPISGRDILLAAMADESVFDKAKQLVKDANGLV